MNRLYFHYSSYDEDGVISTREFRETALAAYEQAIQLAPHEANLHYHRGQLLEQLGRFTEADSAFEEADRLLQYPQTDRHKDTLDFLSSASHSARRRIPGKSETLK